MKRWQSVMIVIFFYELTSIRTAGFTLGNSNDEPINATIDLKNILTELEQMSYIFLKWHKILHSFYLEKFGISITNLF